MFEALLLGIVQGLTEFLPVSSSGHLLLLERYLGVSQSTYGLAFDASLHLGTLAAIIVYFWRDILSLAKGFFQTFVSGLATVESRLFWFIFFGTIPAAGAGVLFEKVIENQFRSPVLVAITLILFSFVIWYAEKRGSKSRDITGIGFFDSLIVGFSQAVALIPGVSRSGITMSSGMFRGLTREAAARFAFLLSIPVIAGAGGKSLFDVATDPTRAGTLDYPIFLIGILSAAISGYLTIRYFISYITKHGLMVFVVYRVVLGLVILAVYFLAWQK